MQTQGYNTGSNSSTDNLSARHRKMLEQGSAIDPEVVAERDVRTIKKGSDLPKVYSWRQRRRAPGLLFTIHRPGSGETSHIFRPDTPDPAKPGCKYLQAPKSRGGDGNVLDVLEGHKIGDMHAPVIFTEGVKKADAITSAARREGTDVLTVAISGVWNWLSEGEPIPDMYEIPVEGRRVYVCFDSDMLRKPEVMMAAERLAEHLVSRGAEVCIVYLADQEDGSKTGADDFLACSKAGGTLEELLGLARPFDPADLQREKLSRSEGLRRGLDYLTRREREMPAKTMRDCSKRAVWRVLVGRAEKHGKPVEDGVRVERLSTREGAERSAMSQPTFSKCIRDLEDEGYLRREERLTQEQATPYVLLTTPDPSQGGAIRYQYGEQGGHGGQGGGPQSQDVEESPLGDNAVPPLPELRWSSPAKKGRRGVVEGTRRVREGRSLAEDRPAVRRPGKKRQEIIAYLAEQGGSATREELLETFGGPKTSWRDFKRRTLADLLGRRRQYRGEDLSMGPPIIELTDEGVRLVEDWSEALEEHREIGGEEEAAIRQKVDHLRQRVTYRRRDEIPPDRAPTEEEMAEGREDRKKRRRAVELVGQGMAPRIATEEVLGADGSIEDLRPAGEGSPDPSEATGDPPESVEAHPLDCECLDCSATTPRYATAFGST